MIQKDKILHFIVGNAVFICSIPISFMLGIDMIMLGTAMVFMAGLGKEVADYVDNRVKILNKMKPVHGVEFLDFVATMAGCLPSIMIITITKGF